MNRPAWKRIRRRKRMHRWADRILILLLVAYGLFLLSQVAPGMRIKFENAVDKLR